MRGGPGFGPFMNLVSRYDAWYLVTALAKIFYRAEWRIYASVFHFFNQLS